MATFRLLATALIALSSLMISCAGQRTVAPSRTALPPELPRLAENNSATLKLFSEKSWGTCFAVSHDGYFVTAYHVVDDGTRFVTCRTMDGKVKTQPVKVVAFDEAQDIAAVKADCWFNHPIRFATRAEVRNGDPVYNIGYPYDFGKMFGRGYVMQRDFDFAPGDMIDGIAVDLPNGHGTSGSAVFFERDGRAIGFMDFIVPRPSFDVPLTIVRVLRSSDDVTRFLDKNHIPHVR